MQTPHAPENGNAVRTGGPKWEEGLNWPVSHAQSCDNVPKRKKLENWLDIEETDGSSSIWLA